MTDPNIGLPQTEDRTRFKMYVGDTGLFVTLCFWEKSFTSNELYQKLLADRLPANLGYVYENLVAQMLKSAGNELFYFTWPKDDKHNYEVDFLLSRENKIAPLEVKSDGYKAHASLDEFCKKFRSRISHRYIIYTKELRQEEAITCVPVYMTPLL